MEIMHKCFNLRHNCAISGIRFALVSVTTGWYMYTDRKLSILFHYTTGS